MRHIVGGWTFSGIAAFQSGNPLTIYSNNNSSELNNNLDRPDLTGPIKVFSDPRRIQTLSGDCGGGTGMFWFDPTNLICTVDYTGSTNPDFPAVPGGVPLFTHGNMGRNMIRGPGINNWDLSIMKNISIGENNSLQFRGEFFNAFNHVQFLSPNSNAHSRTFGQVTSDRGPRVIQLALKMYF